MESKKLHRLFFSKYDTSVWLNEHNEESGKDGFKWYYCGTKEAFKQNFVQQAIKDHFVEDELYLIITSGNSKYVSTAIISEEIGKFLHKKQIGVMNKSLDKIMYFQIYNGEGVFKKGFIKEYPKSRKKIKGTSIETSFRANMYELSTQRIVNVVQEPFDKLSKKLSNDYGGNIEHLWIDLELVESHLEKGKAWPFRFQKRVTLSGFGIPRKEYNYNVGHYSVVPDFEKLKTLPEESICDYVLKLIYESIQILVDKKKKLENFRVEQFRVDFIKACNELGYLIEEK